MNKSIVIFVVGFVACVSKHSELKNSDEFTVIGSTIVQSDSTIILGEKYLALGTNEFKLVVLNSKGDTVLSYPEMYPVFEFRDFNKDSF